MTRRLKVLGVFLGVVVLLAVAIGSTVFADTPGGEDSTQAYCAGYGWHGSHGEGDVCSEAVSELLGLTHEEICEQRQEGNSMVEIAAAQGVGEDELVEAIMAAKREAVQSGVEAGTLTPEQAELVLEQMEEKTRLAVNRTTTGSAEWRGSGYGQSGEGMGPGMMNRWGVRNGQGFCYGDEGLGTGPGGMHRWGGWSH